VTGDERDDDAANPGRETKPGRKLIALGSPPKPINQMSDEERREFSAAILDMARRNARRKGGPDPTDVSTDDDPTADVGD
jgi:hypothetical protein